MNPYISKLLAVVLILIGFESQGIAQSSNPNQQFYNSVNSNWQSQNYASLLSTINTRLQSNPNDVLGLILKAGYYVFAQKDITQAHQAATSFLNVVNAGTTSQNLKNQAQAMANRVLNIPTTDTTSFTPAQITAMHGEL